MGGAVRAHDVKREGHLLDRNDSLGATKSVGQFYIYGEKTPRVNLNMCGEDCRRACQERGTPIR